MPKDSNLHHPALPRGRKKRGKINRDFKIDKSKQTVTIVTEESFEVDDAAGGISDFEKMLRKELQKIINDVKMKKQRAEEIRDILASIKASKAKAK